MSGYDHLITTIKSIIYNDSLDLDLNESDVELIRSLPVNVVIPILQDVFEHETDPTIQARAYRQILSYRDFDKVGFVLDMFDKSTAGWQVAYCESLSHYKDSRAISKLSKVLLENTDPDVRFSAAEALEEIGDSTSVEALEYAIQNDQGVDYGGFSVSKMAHEALLKVRRRIE